MWTLWRPASKQRGNGLEMSLNENDRSARKQSTVLPVDLELPKVNSSEYTELKVMAKKAETIRRSVWKASLVTSILTIALAFLLSALLGNQTRDRQVAENAAAIEAVVQQARQTSCINQRIITKLLVDMHGTPRVAAVQVCEKLPEVTYTFYTERGRNER